MGAAAPAASDTLTLHRADAGADACVGPLPPPAHITQPSKDLKGEKMLVLHTAYQTISALPICLQCSKFKICISPRYNKKIKVLYLFSLPQATASAIQDERFKIEKKTFYLKQNVLCQQHHLVFLFVG